MPKAGSVGRRIRTGLRILDERLGGGFPKPSTVLLLSEIPAEKRLFAEHFVITGLRSGETCLYVDFFRAPQLARREFSRFGRYPDDRLTIVDATSTQLLLPSEERYAIHDIGDLDHIMDTIERALNDKRPSRAIVDSMDFLTDRFEKEKVMKRWRQLIEVAKSAGSLVCFLFMNWTYKEIDMLRIAKMSDYILEFQMIAKDVASPNSFRIRETRKNGMCTAWINYTFKDFVGLTLSFPRILITGPPRAGKSSVVRALSRTAVSLDRLGATVAFDYANVELLGFETEILSAPGNQRFEPIFRVFAREVSGVMLVVDATRPKDFERARKMLDLVGPDLPCVVLANKSDLRGALPPDAVRKALRLPAEVPVFATVAKQGVMVREALLALAQTIVGVR